MEKCQSRTELIAALNQALVDLALLANGATTSTTPKTKGAARRDTPPGAFAGPRALPAVHHWADELNATLADAERQDGLHRCGPYKPHDGSSIVTARAARLVALDDVFAARLDRLVRDVQREVTAFRHGEHRAAQEHGPRIDPEQRLRHELLTHPFRVSQGVERVTDDDARLILRRECARAGLTFADLARVAWRETNMSEQSLRETIARFNTGSRPMRRDLWATLAVAAFNA